MIDEEKLARASDPNTPLEELEELVFSFPQEVLANPALDLLVLAEPARVERLRQNAHYQIARRELGWEEASLPFPEYLRFGAFCLNRMLPAYERKVRDDHVPAFVRAAHRYVVTQDAGDREEALRLADGVFAVAEEASRAGSFGAMAMAKGAGLLASSIREGSLAPGLISDWMLMALRVFLPSENNLPEVTREAQVLRDAIARVKAGEDVLGSPPPRLEPAPLPLPVPEPAPPPAAKTGKAEAVWFGMGLLVFAVWALRRGGWR